MVGRKGRKREVEMKSFVVQSRAHSGPESGAHSFRQFRGRARKIRNLLFVRRKKSGKLLGRQKGFGV